MQRWYRLPPDVLTMIRDMQADAGQTETGVVEHAIRYAYAAWLQERGR